MEITKKIMCFVKYLNTTTLKNPYLHNFGLLNKIFLSTLYNTKTKFKETR